MEQQGKQIVLINDMPGYGKVALAAMVPILSAAGHYTFQLPTAVISNTLDFGTFRIQDMTDYMRDTMGIWEELGFEADCICTGFVLSVEQAYLIEEYMERQKAHKNPLILVDPIMADSGKLYNGVGMERVDAMRKLASHADIIVPNITEASFLTGISPGKEQRTRSEIRELLDGLRQISGKSAVITSVELEESGEHLVCGYDHRGQEYFEVLYEHMPVRVAGTGDIFSAVLTREQLAGHTLKAGAERAVTVLSSLLLANEPLRDSYKGINIERYWEVLGK